MEPEFERPWRKILRADAIRVGEMRVARVGTRQVVVASTPTGVHVFRNHCPHAGAPLSGGKLTEDTITCPRHRWEFQLEDGHCPAHPIYTLRRFEVRVEDGWIFAQEEEEEIW